MSDRHKLTENDVIGLLNIANKMPPDRADAAAKSLKDSVAIGVNAFESAALFTYTQEIISKFPL
jgi:hypothetical protein